MTESDRGQRIVWIGIKFTQSCSRDHATQSSTLVAAKRTHPNGRISNSSLDPFVVVRSCCRSRRPSTGSILLLPASSTKVKLKHVFPSLPVLPHAHGGARRPVVSIPEGQLDRTSWKMSLLGHGSFTFREGRRSHSVRTPATCPTAAARSPRHHGHPETHRSRSKNFRFLFAGLGQRHRSVDCAAAWRLR